MIEEPIKPRNAVCTSGSLGLSAVALSSHCAMQMSISSSKSDQLMMYESVLVCPALGSSYCGWTAYLIYALLSCVRPYSGEEAWNSQEG